MHATLRLLRPALAVLALGLVGRAAAQSSAGSPFMPPANVTANAAAPGETLEFGGINVMGAKTMVNVYDKTLKKGRWIEVGGSDGAYSVLAFDPRREQIVVKTPDSQKTLTLRKSTGPMRGPAPVAIMPAAAGFAVPDNGALYKLQPAPPPSPADPAGPVPVAAATPSPATPPVEAAPPPKSDAPAKPLTVARQEEEARMLVSDLLEIGMAQRKAYEEAQKKAAGGTAEQPGAAPATPNPGG